MHATPKIRLTTFLFQDAAIIMLTDADQFKYFIVKAYNEKGRISGYFKTALKLPRPASMVFSMSCFEWASETNIASYALGAM